jgi:hypothetical protein
MRFKVQIYCLISLILGQQETSWAFIDARFPEEKSSQVVHWRDSESYFSQENSEKKDLPLWIHLGDSISTGWATTTTLAERVEREKSNPELEKSQLKVIEESLPKDENSWFAGKNFDFGIFGFLERKTQKSWIVYTAARSGALLNDSFRDAITTGFVPKREAHRAKLVTLSIGSNDLCLDRDPFSKALENKDTPSTKKKLQELKEFYPNAKFVVFTPAPLADLKNAIFNKLSSENLSDSAVGKSCHAFYTQFCPAVLTTEGQKNLEVYRNRMIKQFQEIFGDLFDPLGKDLDDASINIFDFISSDCFHPSKHLHKQIYERMVDFLDKNPL